MNTEHSEEHLPCGMLYCASVSLLVDWDLDPTGTDLTKPGIRHRFDLSVIYYYLQFLPHVRYRLIGTSSRLQWRCRSSEQSQNEFAEQHYQYSLSLIHI